MIQKIEPYRLMSIYKEVYKYGISVLEEMTDYEILQIREYASNVFIGGEKAAFMLYSAYLNANSDYLKQIPDEYKNGREIEYIGLRHVNHYYESVHVLKTIERYFESKQIKGKVEKTSVESQILKKQETKFAEKYYSFFHLMLVHEIRIVKEFGRDKNDHYLKKDNGYKAKIIKISGNDNRIIEKLKNYPN